MRCKNRTGDHQTPKLPQIKEQAIERIKAEKQAALTSCADAHAQANNNADQCAKVECVDATTVEELEREIEMYEGLMAELEKSFAEAMKILQTTGDHIEKMLIVLDEAILDAFTSIEESLVEILNEPSVELKDQYVRELLVPIRESTSTNSITYGFLTDAGVHAL